MCTHETLATSPEADVRLCNRCNQQFTSWHKLALHRFAAHGLRSEADSFAGGVTCPACLKRHWTRPRLLRHLQHGFPKCLSALSAHDMNVSPLQDGARDELAVLP